MASALPQYTQNLLAKVLHATSVWHVEYILEQLSKNQPNKQIKNPAKCRFRTKFLDLPPSIKKSCFSHTHLKAWDINKRQACWMAVFLIGKKLLHHATQELASYRLLILAFKLSKNTHPAALQRDFWDSQKLCIFHSQVMFQQFHFHTQFSLANFITTLTQTPTSSLKCTDFSSMYH